MRMCLVCPLGRSAAWVGGTALGVAGCAKLSPKSRRSAEQTALATLLPGQLRHLARPVWVLIGLAEAGMGAGLLTHQRSVRRAAPVVGLAIAGYAILASRRAPDRPCGCLGAASQESAWAGIPRALLMAGLCLASTLRGEQARANQHPQARTALTAVITAGLAVLLVRLSPERRQIARHLKRRRLARQLASRDLVLRRLPEATSWRILAPVVAPGAAPSLWQADGNHYLEFPARPDSGATTVAFMAYLPAGSDAVSFRGALVREPSGEVLLQVQG